MQTLWWLIFVGFVLVIIVPIKMHIRLSYNLHSNRGILGFKVLFFKKRISTFKFKNMTLQIKNRNAKKKKEVEVKIEKEELLYTKRLVAQFRDKLKIKNLNFIASVGTGDAFESAMLSGLINILVTNVFIFIKNFKQTVGVEVKTKPYFNKEMFKFKTDMIISISLFDLVFCFLFALINTKRSISYEERVKRFKFGGKTFRHQHSKN
jgi:hypothetical protein